MYKKLKNEYFYIQTHLCKEGYDKRKKKHLTNWPYQYVDRNGCKWFNTTYRNGYGQLRKWC